VKRRDEAGRWLYGKLALQLNVASRWLGFDAHDLRAVQLVSTTRSDAYLRCAVLRLPKNCRSCKGRLWQSGGGIAGGAL
jgi:hypothetical protein